ncbi:hypothetical protein TL16_g01566 [Triparma laevis f. inornata]|nr:hypothetical protein TL16_g01566 [Triparma laevis f. inornata]
MKTLLSYQSSLPTTPNLVPWGGPSPHTPTYPFTSSDIHLLESYMVVQNYPSNFKTNWPNSQCKDMCDSTFSYYNTLKWRESYHPFSILNSLKSEAESGWLYTRGITKNTPQPIIYYRPGLHAPVSLESYMRNVIYNLDRAAAVASYNTGNDVKYLGGKGRNDPRRYYFVLDCKGFRLSMIPSMAAVRKLFGMVGDHYPRR